MRIINLLNITFFCLAFIATSIAQNLDQDYGALVNTAIKHYKEGDFRNSLKAYQNAFKIKKDNASDFYNAACSASLFGKRSIALDYLEISLSLGWSNSDHLEKDQDLYNLHPLPQWKEIVANARQNSKDLSVTALVSKVESLIESRNTKELINMVNSDSGSVDKSELSKRIEFIYDFLRKNKIVRLDNLIKSSNNSYSLRDGASLETYLKIYNLIPRFFDKHTTHLFTFPLGFEVHLLLEKANGKWQLYNIEVINKMFESNYALKDDIKDFLSKIDSVLFRFAISNSTKQIAGTGSINLSDLIFLKNDPKLVYVNFEEVISEKDNSDSYMSLVLVKNDPSYNLPFPNLFKNSKRPVSRLEFIFSRTNPKTCLISNGLGYGFYQTDLAVEIEKFVMTELYTIK